ncbi:MAG: hypothetical protein OXP12_07235 [Thaumarchaeota archaeon]|nr:hypothetical protein [Nitrososphaerota archaeon]MDE0266217.1 hypothetical protein [Nitrososphaerota archaeon]MDE0526469.1 hypothetical protein [Nitrososphaerota archaeon]
MGIYRVKIYGKTRAELEVTADGTILCTVNGGPASHFAVPLRDLVFAEQVSHDTVLLNFFHASDMGSLVQVFVTSENCASMLGEIMAAVSSSLSSPTETKGPAALGDD